MRICVLGLGYIGLPTAALLAQSGHLVVGVDVDESLLSRLESLSFDFEEPGLNDLVSEQIANGALVFSRTPVSADVYLVAVPTPINQDKVCDLSILNQAIADISSVIPCGALVLIESTSPVGTTDKLFKELLAKRKNLSGSGGAGADLLMAYCPERIIPGKALEELVENDRVVGGVCDDSAEAAISVYRSFALGRVQKVNDAKTAELCKLVENSFRDVNLAFANEISIIADSHGIDALEVIAEANRHPRVQILSPGVGVGGHCIAVDPWFIVESAPDQAQLIRVAREVNDAKPAWVVSQITDLLTPLLNERSPVTLGLLGLSFKPDVGDLRNSPAVQVYERLRGIDGVDILIVEPIADVADLVHDQVTNDLEKAIATSDLLVALVGHTVFVEKRDTLADHKNFVDFTGLIA